METAGNLTFNVETQRPCNQNIIRSSFVWLVVCISRDVRTSVISTIVVEGTLIWWNLQVGISKSKMPASIGVFFFKILALGFFTFLQWYLEVTQLVPLGYHDNFFKLKNRWFLRWVAKPSSRVLPYTKPLLGLMLAYFQVNTANSSRLWELKAKLDNIKNTCSCHQH